MKSLLLSPYPLHYTLRWPFYFNWPSMRNHGRMPLVADSFQFDEVESEKTRLLFCGDIMVQNGDRVPVLHPELCSLIGSADYFIGNCEAPVAKHAKDAESKYKFTFNMPESFLQEIIQQTNLPAEKWLLSMANNHACDMGYDACEKTFDTLQGMGVQPLGRYSENALPLQIITHKNLRLGFLAWTEWMNSDVFPAHDPGVLRGKHALQQDWNALKVQHNLDYLIGIPHWEYEFQHFPNGKTRKLAKKLIEQQGIDLVVGVHTHTLQAMEWFKQGICVYNLGNFCGLARAWSVKLISLLEVNLHASGESKGRLASYKMHYFFQEHQGDKVSIIPLDAAPLKTRQRIKQRIAKIYLPASEP